MAQLYLQSQVVYPPGPWGVNVPVAGASVEIIDADAPGNDDDVIWSGRTGDDGYFSGRSSDWRDQVPYDVFVPDSLFSGHWETHYSPDYTDVLALTAHIVADGQETWSVFVYLGDDIPSPPLAVSWTPPNAAPLLPAPPGFGDFTPLPFIPLANVNGIMCSTPADVSAHIRAEIEKGANPIRIEVVEPFAVQFMRASGAIDRATAWAGERLGIPEQWRPGANQWLDDDAPALAVGCAVVKSGAGVSPLLVAIGVALLYAVDRGYLDVTADSIRKSRRMPGMGVRFTASR